MPRQTLLSLVLLALTACGPMRHRSAETLPPMPDAASPAAAVSPAPVSAISPAAAVSPAPVSAISPAAAVSPAPASAKPRLGCGDHPSVDALERRLRNERRSSTTALLARGEAVLPELQRFVAEAGAPRGLSLLPAIESGFRAAARGRRGERGLWQLKERRARQLGLVVTGARDDRLDLELATRAAAHQLLALQERYGDWALTLAAYVAGEGRVDRALRDRRGATFWELADDRRLPRTARDFVTNAFALVRVAEPEECERNAETTSL